MNITYIVLFGLAALVHLYASFTKNKTLRAISKPILMPTLLAFYLSNATSPSIYVVMALIFSWLGDLFLIPKGIKYFTFGGISFMISHIFFILAYSMGENVFGNDWYIYAIFGALFVVITFIVFINLRKSLKKPLQIPIGGYLLLNGAMNCFAIFRLFGSTTIANGITVIGALLFFISDVILFFVRFDKNCKIKTHFWVMIAYLAGEFLIILGLLL